MKKACFIICMVFLCTNVTFSQDWSTDFETSKEQAKKQNKCVLLVFKGSDWCAPCMKLDQKIFLSDYFISNYEKNFILVEADFPRKKKNALSKELQNSNNKLAESYNQNGHFPLVLVLDSDGNILGKTGYNKLSPAEYLNSLVAFTK